MRKLTVDLDTTDVEGLRPPCAGANRRADPAAVVAHSPGTGASCWPERSARWRSSPIQKSSPASCRGRDPDQQLPGGLSRRRLDRPDRCVQPVDHVQIVGQLGDREHLGHLCHCVRTHTVLRPVFFLPNLCGMVRDDTVATAARDGRVAMIDARDIAAVAVAALTAVPAAGRVYTFTGPEAVAFDHMADVLGQQAGRTSAMFGARRHVPSRLAEACRSVAGPAGRR